MRTALELLTFQNTAPGAVFTAMTALIGDSGVLRNTQKSIKLLAAWQNRQAAGNTRILSPLLHDNVRGIQFSSSAGLELGFGLTQTPYQELFPQDTLSFSGTGSAVAGDIEQSSILVRYEDLPGIDGNFITSEQLQKRFVNKFGVRTVLGQTVVTGQYDGSSAINATEDALKANTEYAILGLTIGVGAATSIGLRSPDWGNLRVGVPASAAPAVTSDWFYRLSLFSKLACIPVFNSSNKGTTLVDYSDNETSTGSQPVIQLAELK